MTTPRKLSARYELGEILGFGGMSEVHLARDVRLSRDVAIKVLRADLARDPTFYLRFKREAQNAAALNHPAIVAVYDTGEAETDGGPLPYIVMEYVDGETLRDLVRSKGPLPPRRAMEIIADVCAALDFSHKNGIVHRDMKPANIMINRSGAVKVMDFGIARAISDSSSPMTQTAAVIGTAQYLSPEQARGEQVDARSDVYSVGCVLFEILTGEPPFTGDSPVSVAYQHVREEPRRPSDVYDGVPQELDAVILKAMSKNPANRYQSAAEMRSDLVRVLGGQKPSAPAVMSDEDRTSLLGAAGAAGSHRHRAPARHPDGDDGEPRSRGKIIAISAAALVAALVIGGLVYLFSPIGRAGETTVPNVAGSSAGDAQSALENAGFHVFLQRKASGTVPSGSAIDTKPAGGSQATKGSTITLEVSTGPQQIQVPRLAGLSQSDAEDYLDKDGLKVDSTVARRESSLQDKDKVISQDPPAGTTVAAGSTVKITLGAGPKNLQVPDVSGDQLADAQATLQQAGLTVVTQQVPSEEPKGTVVNTSPAAGTTVKPGATVTVNVSNGVPLTMPNLVGMTPQDAQTQLQAQGWSGKLLQNTITTINPDYNGHIISQQPAAGGSLGKNDPVSVSVGKWGF